MTISEGIKSIWGAFRYRKDSNGRKERNQRKRALDRQHEKLSKQQAMKSMLMSVIKDKLDRTSDNSILIELTDKSEESLAILDSILLDQDLLASFDITRDKKDPTLLIVGWKTVELDF